MGFWRSLGGTALVRITSSEPCEVLQMIAERGVILYGVILKDPLTAEFAARRNDLEIIKRIAQGRGERMEILRYGGFFWRIKSLIHRKVLVTGCGLLLLLALFLPTRVLFIEVEGNSQVPSALISQTASQCGIYFGASRVDVRSERVKNALLQAIPQLQWVGVNTSGCSATIHVREKTAQNQTGDTYAVSRIVACRDAVVSAVVCTSGNILVVPGQAVKEGQTLISGYTDCGLSIRAERAQGEVFAFTNRTISAVLPENDKSSCAEHPASKQVSFIIGKKRINLWKDSGISCTSCVKIYEEKWVTLPGGFRLPVALAVETTYCGEITAATSDAQLQLRRFASDYLRGQMISGSILTGREEFTQEEACLVLDGQYECLEMIGRERGEEIVHGEND